MKTRLALRFRLDGFDGLDWHAYFPVFTRRFAFRAVGELSHGAALGLHPLLFQPLHFLLALLECGCHRISSSSEWGRGRCRDPQRRQLPLPARFARLTRSFAVILV